MFTLGTHVIIKNHKDPGEIPLTSLKLKAVITAIAFSLPSVGYTHEWYTGKVNPVTKISCCNGVDCKRIAHSNYWREGNDWIVEWFDGKEYRISNSEVQFSDDGKPAACVYGGKLRCLFIVASF